MLESQPTLLLNDAVNIPGVPMKQVSIIKGDAKSISIGAASIIAKVTRDAMMVDTTKYILNMILHQTKDMVQLNI